MTDPRLPASDLIIGADRVHSTAAGILEHVNPATGTWQAEVVLAGPAEVDAAVAAARGAEREWRALPASDRRDLLWKIAALLEENREELATTGILENGTPSAFATVACSTFPAEYFRYFAGWCEKIAGETAPTYPGKALDYVLHEPFGVVAAMVPFNGPLGLIAMKIPAALAAGNTVVLKPSELAPFTALRFGELCLEAGFPPGVVNIITGDVSCGQALVAHPGTDQISFTGGTATGRAIMNTASQRLSPMSLELGGKSAALVFSDADLDEAIATAVRTGLVMQSGQACMAPTRLLVERNIYDEVVHEIVGLAEAVEVGDPFDPATLMGPLISQASCERVLGVVERARREGEGRLVTGGRRIDGTLAAGYFVEPTVFADVDPMSALAQEEIFGPVLSIIPFDTEREALEIANNTIYGLAGFVFTSDLRRAHRVAAALEAGYIGVNTFPLLPAPAPFGGYKQSGFGRELGAAGVAEFTRTKNVYVNLA